VKAPRPGDADRLVGQALPLLVARRFAEAEPLLEQALAAEPRHLSALVNLGAARKAAGRHAEAEALYRRALALAPADVVALRNLGALLNGNERHAEALAVAEAALAAGAGEAALQVRGAALHGLGRYDEARADFAAAIDGGAEPYEPLTRIALADAACGRYAEALASLDAAVALKPDEVIALYRRGPIRLMTGDFRGGWADYETRWREESFVATNAPMAPPAIRALFDPRRTVADLAGRRILVVGEQGIGDQVMFASILPEVIGVAAQVTCVCDARLVRLFSASMPGAAFVAPEAARLSRSAFDVVEPLGGLGRLFRNRREDFPGRPYLQPRAGIREGWAARLGPRPPGGLRIGVSWRGGTARTRAGARSLPLAELVRGLDLGPSQIVSLQYGDPRADVAAAQAELGREIVLFPTPEIDDYEDLAGLVANLDAVVTVQTAVAHLSGALGAPTFVLLPQVPEWRYMAQGTAMPWYGSAQLFRQTERGVWGGPLERIARALRTLPVA
jgi:tetratricopeptide (TPR) repeat protein